MAEDRSSSGLLLGIVGVLVIIAALIAVSAFATRAATTAADTARATASQLTTTMAPVQPVDEAAAPPASRSGVAPAWVGATCATPHR